MKCYNNKIRNYAGMTLVEIIVSLSIMSIIFASIVPLFRNIQNSWDSKAAVTEMLQNGRVLTDHLNRNITKAIKIIAVSESNETNGYMEFEDNDGNNLRYEIASSYVQFGQAGNLADLAGPVSTLQFTCYDTCDLDTPLDISSADINDIRFVKAETTLTNLAALGQDRTMIASAYLRAHWNSCSSDLAGWWKLDETSGLTAADSSGNGNDGTLTNMTGDEWTTGIVDGALVFDGSDDVVECGNPSSLQLTGTEVSVSAWFYADSLAFTDWPTLFGKSSNGEWDDGWGAFFYDGAVRFYVNKWDTNVAYKTFTSTNSWHHLAGTYDGTTIKVYIDGVKGTDDNYSEAINDAGDFTIGEMGDWSTGRWHGKIDDVRIYDRVLSAEEIYQLSNHLRYTELTEAKATSDTTSITISTPSGISEDDLLIVAVVTDGATSSSLSPPVGEGWTEIDVGDYSSEVTLGVWWKLADPSESSTHEFTWSGDEQAYAWMMQFTGHNPDNPIKGWAANEESSINPISPAVITTVDNCIILRLGVFDDDDITLNNPGLSGHTAITMDTSGGTITAMYWADEEVDKIQRADLDGSNIEDLVTAVTMQPRALALDIAGGKMYWADENVGKIQRANLDGSNIEDIVSNIDKPRALALDIADGKMYWADEEVDKIQRANLDGSNIEDLVIAVTMKPRALALDIADGKMYWADEEVDKIQRADLDGSNIEDLVTAVTMQPRALALDIAGGKMYWADENVGKIQRANLDGSNIEDIVSNIDKPKALALALNEAGSGEPISGGAGYVDQSVSGDSGTSNFSLTESEQSRTITIVIAPRSESSGNDCEVFP